MNELQRIQTMSSREIAELTGKSHNHVLRDCDVLNESYENLHLPKIGQMYSIRHLPNGGNANDRYFELTKMQTLDLMTGYSIELRIKVNRRWEELETGTAIPLTPKTPNEMFMMQAHINIETEKRIEKIEEDTEDLKKGLAEIKQVQEQARFNMDYTPLSSEQVPEMSQRMAINYLVSLYQRKNQIGYDEIWNYIYSQLYFRHKVAIRRCKREKGETWLDVAERKGHLDKIHGIISNLLNS